MEILIRLFVIENRGLRVKKKTEKIGEKKNGFTDEKYDCVHESV